VNISEVPFCNFTLGSEQLELVNQINMDNPESIISKLGLQPHPEGGWYKETYRCQSLFEGDGDFPAGRSYATAIYFLISSGSFSALHRIQSDETWHFYEGAPFEIVEITSDGRLLCTQIGRGNYQYTVSKGNWFGSRVLSGGDWSLVGCTVAPGFDFRDFELADRNDLIRLYPDHAEIITQMTRFS
jgi:predicted cupin superfamily sugar epimerase